jgi:predicted  nucleic acid-binding Zn-ribbon protein
MTSAAALSELLEVQALDTIADQLRHRREHMPERTELADRNAKLAELEARASEVQGERDAISASEKRLEDEVALVAEKAKGEDRRLYSGTVNIPRELTALQDEIASLRRRQRQLEDQELELMEQAEPLDAALAKFATSRSVLDADAVQLSAAIAEAETQIDFELADVLAKRSAAVERIPSELLKEYEALRGGLGGIGVARLSGNRCEGCHLTLSAVDVDRIRHAPDDVLAHCTECGRLLVRA